MVLCKTHWCKEILSLTIKEGAVLGMSQRRHTVESYGMDAWMRGRVDGGGWMDGWVDGCVGGWMDGWMGLCVEGWV